MGTEKRQGMGRDGSKEPGPGNYDLKSAAFNDNAKFAYGQRLKEASKLDVPGAGTYDSPMYYPKEKKAPSFAMGIKLKSEFGGPKGNPGPG